MSTTVEIIEYRDELAHYFRDLNVAWLEKYFYVEPIDKEMLSDPKSYIIDNGGYIFLATVNGNVAGTFALMKLADGSYELSKMAVDEQYQGQKIGNQMLGFCLEKAAALGADKVILYSNTLLGPAIHLYKKFGFVEVPLGDVDYKRANIKMERNLTPGPSPLGEGKERAFHKAAIPILFKYARENRRDATTTEDLLWQYLRDRRFEGLKFRRQHPIGEYIVDFYCHEKSLVIELDGSVHNLKEVAAYDEARERYLKDLNLNVIRFKNEEIESDIINVLEKIKRIIKL